MSLARAWARALFGAGGAAMIAPATLIAALAVLAFSGGFGRISDLGQVLAGPAAPQTNGVASVRSSRANARFVAALAGAGFGATANGRGASGGGALAGGAGGAGAAAGGTRAPRSGSGGSNGSGGSGGGSPSSFGGGSSGGGPGRPPSHGRTVADEVVGAGTSVTSRVPGPVGPIATKTLQSIGSTLDQLVPVPAPGGSVRTVLLAR